MISIIDYEAGNARSVERAISKLGHKCRITQTPAHLDDADKIIFPGVGAAAEALHNLGKNRLNLIESLKKNVIKNKKPILGICLGIQIILSHSEEGDTACLDFIPGKVKKFNFPSNSGIKTPHMGWNSVKQKIQHAIFKDVPDNSYFYFVHSYYSVVNDPAASIGTTEYGGFEFTSIIAKDNIIATQFHIEKSGEVGLKMLDNFCKEKKQITEDRIKKQKTI
jgi:glutamine amidotransferase